MSAGGKGLAGTCGVCMSCFGLCVCCGGGRVECVWVTMDVMAACSLDFKLGCEVCFCTYVRKRGGMSAQPACLESRAKQ